MSKDGDTATDAELCKILGAASYSALYAMAAGKRNTLFIDTEDGQWMKYEGSRTWTFYQSAPY